MINQERILNEFEEYLKESGMYTDGTCRCYAKNYVKNAFEFVLTPWFLQNYSSSPLDYFDNDKLKSEQRALIATICDSLLSSDIIDLCNTFSTKTISNWRSGVRAFFTFLETEDYYFCTSIQCDIAKEALITTVPLSKYSMRELSNVFIKRLITQDRAYNNMIYPARLLNRIFNNSKRKKEYKELLESAVDNIKFLINNMPSHKRLSEISLLTLDRRTNDVEIVCGLCKWFVYTETPLHTYEQIKVNGLDDLSLDHDVSLQELLDDPSKAIEYPFLKRLSNIYASFVLGASATDNYLSVADIRNFKAHSPNCYKSISAGISSTFVDGLWLDLQELYSHISITIMLRSYNSCKGSGR